MLVNDNMHEWEGGDGKRVNSYLIRVLNSIDAQLVTLLDER